MSSDFQRIGGQLGGPASPFNKNASPFNKNASAGFDGVSNDGSISRALINTSLRLDSDPNPNQNYKNAEGGTYLNLFSWDPEIRIGLCTGSLLEYLQSRDKGTGKILAAKAEIVNGFENEGKVVLKDRITVLREIEAQAKQVYDLRDRRPDYEDQILTQMDGFWPYWTALTNISPTQSTYTAEMLATIAAAAMRIVQQLKHAFAIPRPIVVIPGIMPMIRTPGHGSYPSGHATVSHLEAKVLNHILGLGKSTQLNRMADRITKNREIAGVHYSNDSEAGKALADIIFKDIQRFMDEENAPVAETGFEFSKLYGESQEELRKQGFLPSRLQPPQNNLAPK